jgi:hypothetical protein
MKVQKIIWVILIGSICGMLIALAGILQKKRVFYKEGIWVPTRYITKDKAIYLAVKTIRPFFKTGLVTVNSSYTNAIHQIDMMLKNALTKNTKLQLNKSGIDKLLIDLNNGKCKSSTEAYKTSMNNLHQYLTDLIL